MTDPMSVDRILAEELEELQFHNMQIIAEAAILEEARLMEEDVSAHPNPAGEKDLQKFMKQANRVLRRQRLVRDCKKAYAAFAKVAVILLIIVVGGVCTVINVEAVRRPFLNWLIDVQETHTSIQFIPNTSTLSPLDFGYLPEGFQVSSVDETPASITYHLESSTGEEIIVMESDLGAGISLDTEDADVKKFQLEDKYPAMSIEKDGLSTIIWPTDLASFLIYGEINCAELIKIAESISISE